MNRFKKVLKMKLGTKSDGKQTCERMEHGDDLVPCRLLLNRRQCEDLTTKLAEIHENIQSLVEGIKLMEHLKPAMQEFYRCSEKAKMLIANCGERAWWRVAIFQWQNENAFREILLELSLCYHVLYEEVIFHRGILASAFQSSPDDLRKSTKFECASVDDVREDEEDLSLMLEKLVTHHESIEREYCPTKEELPLAQSLASYLLLKMQWAAKQSLASQTEKCRAIMWGMEGEHPKTWGAASFVPGAGSSLVSGWRIKWLGLHCFKKEFHGEGEAFEKLFIKEAAIMAHLKHPNIIQFLCWGKGHESRFIGMELMEKNLLKLIEDQKGVSFSLEVIFDIVWQIARGMCYLHDQGIAHRDLKPQNVMVNKLTSQHSKGYWQVKVIDYGSSKTEVEIEKSNAITHFNIGTGVYRAPEVLKLEGLKSRGRAMWIKADVFSFAMTCVHVLTLQQPFKDMGRYSLDHLYDEVMNGKRPSLPNNCPKELSTLLRGCWNIIPIKRPTFVEICSRLETLKHGMRRSTFKKEKLQLSIDFPTRKIEGESSYFKSLPKVIFAQDIHEDENKPSEPVSIISCACNKKLVIFDKTPYIEGFARCNMCGEDIDGETYHCSNCHFDAHQDCAEIREIVRVCFHAHPLQLLTLNYYKNNPKAKCSVCEESIQYSDWVYRCEQCDYDVHARCTKFQNSRKWINHEHPLNMRTCPPCKSLLCDRCNGEIEERTWHYYCAPCAFSMHLFCAISSMDPICAIENSHRLYSVYSPRIFYCALCHTQGHSEFYCCKQCKIDIHPNCVDHMDDRTCNLNEAYEKAMMEKESKDIHAQMIIISSVVDIMASLHVFRGRSAIQRPQSAVRKVHTSIHKLGTTPNKSHDSLDLGNDVNLVRKMIITQTAERIKSKKLASSKLRDDPLEMLENLKKIVTNLQSFKNVSGNEKKELLAMHKRLKEWQELLMDKKAIQEESKMCSGPRIGVFFTNVVKDGRVVRQLIIDLQAGMMDVCFGLLCEKPGHEHIVPGKTRVFNQMLGEEFKENLKPLLACGLQIVRNNITKDDLVELEFISMRNLEASKVWDLSAINKIKGMENMEVLKQAALSSSEWFLKLNEIRGNNMKEAYGLHRIGYKVTDEGDPPHYKNGSLAWLCEKHFDDGLKEGILESYSSKYHNVEDDYEIRYPPHLRQI